LDKNKNKNREGMLTVRIPQIIDEWLGLILIFAFTGLFYINICNLEASSLKIEI
jgi:hypothetical protein